MTTADQLEIVPPHDRDAEASLVGAVLLDAPFALAEVGEIARPDMLYDRRLGLILEAAFRLHDQRAPVDLVSLKAELDRRGQLVEVGGLDHLRHVLEAVPTAANARHYAALVRDGWIRREARTALARLLREANEPALDESGAAFAARAASTLGQVADGAQLEVDTPFHELLAEALAPRAQSERIVLTALGATHERLGPLWRGALLLVAGRPGHGKSQVLRTLALHLADLGQVLYLAIEEGADATACAFIAHKADVPKAAIRARDLSYEQAARCHAAGVDMAELPIVIDAHGAPSIDYLTARARRLHRRAPVAGVIVDYVQLMDHRRSRSETDAQAIGRTSRGLKRLAKDLNCVVAAGSQLTRDSQRAGWKGSRPKLHELRDSGSLEADADSVWGVWARAEAQPDSYPAWAEGVLELSRMKGRWEPRSRSSARAQQSPLVVCDGAGVVDDTTGDAATLRRIAAYREGVRGEG